MRLSSLPVVVAVSLAFGLTFAATPANAQKPRSGSTPPAATQQGATQVTIINNSRMRIDIVNVSPTSDDSWGDDALGNDTLPPRRRLTVELPGERCDYDLRVVYQDRREETMRDVDLCAQREIAFTGRNAVAQQTTGREGVRRTSGRPEFTLVNGSSVRIDYLYVSPVTSDDWGQDVLGDGTIRAGASQVVRLNPANECMFDLRIVYTDERSEERRAVNLCEETRVTFTAENARARQPRGRVQ